MGEIEILDYTGSRIISSNNIAIDIGKVKIESGKFRVIHTRDLGTLKKALVEIFRVLEEIEVKAHPLYLYLHYEATQVEDLLAEFNPHIKKRSINLISIAWKWIAGSPDHDDFVMIKKKMNSSRIITNKLL